MAWIKRNLILVISGAVCVVLLGLGTFYFYSANKKNREISEAIESTKAEIQRLLDAQVTPTADNLKLAKQEAVKLSSFVTQAKQLFPATPLPSEPLTSPSFKSLLANTVNELNRKAQSVPTRLDTNRGSYYFTFESQRLALNLPPESLRPLHDRLMEVQSMSHVLFDAHIHRLVGMRRAMVPGERPAGGAGQPGGGDDYLPSGPKTNSETGMMLWPYEITFDSFTPEIASVVESLQKLKLGLIIKAIEVRPADETPTQPGRPPFGQPGGQPPRPNFPPRGPRNNPNAAAPAPAANSGGLVTIINERLVRTTLLIDIVKPDIGGGFGGPGGPGGPGRRGGNPFGGGNPLPAGGPGGPGGPGGAGGPRGPGGGPQ